MTGESSLDPRIAAFEAARKAHNEVLSLGAAVNDATDPVYAEADQERKARRLALDGIATGEIPAVDFAGHREEIAADRSPFGPVSSREVKLGKGIVGSGNVPGETQDEGPTHPSEASAIQAHGRVGRTSGAVFIVNRTYQPAINRPHIDHQVFDPTTGLFDF